MMQCAWIELTLEPTLVRRNLLGRAINPRKHGVKVANIAVAVRGCCVA
jgi:hypothetical protein